MDKNVLCKAERLSSKLIIEKIFAGGAKSFSAFPLRVVFTCPDNWENVVNASVLVSVSKKRFKRAVERNRVKRQIREAYRKNKHNLLYMLEEKKLKLAIAFIYLDNKLITSAEIEKRVCDLLARITEKAYE